MRRKASRNLWKGEGTGLGKFLLRVTEARR
jgi:hypothetical protein